MIAPPDADGRLRRCRTCGVLLIEEEVAEGAEECARCREWAALPFPPPEPPHGR